MTKALREAKTHTNWLSPDHEYEAAVERFVRTLLDPQRPFLDAFLSFQSRVAEAGIYNSLSQLLLKVTAPGIPDFYQGTELWDLTLVDPDNRRPVDYVKRHQLLSTMQPCPGCDAADHRLRELFDRRVDGRVKMFVTARALAARSTHRELFERGEYLALKSAGVQREHIFAFARRSTAKDREPAMALTCVPRLVAALTSDRGTPPLGPAVWGDTCLHLPDSNHLHFRDVFTNAVIDAEDRDGGWSLPASRVFATFPVALLVSAAAD